MRSVDLIYVVVPCSSHAELERIRAAVGRPWLQGAGLPMYVRYWVETYEDAENERALMALAGLKSTIEIRESLTWDLKA
jgi:hypothetical protein